MPGRWSFRGREDAALRLGPLSRMLRDGETKEGKGMTTETDALFVHPRASVIAFAHRMELVLRKNDWKGGWTGMRPRMIVNRMWDELRELNACLRDGCSPEETAREAVDIANFAMFLCDVLESRR